MLTKRQIHALTRGMAAALLAGSWEFDPMATRLADALGRHWRWCRPLVGRLIEHFDEKPAFNELVNAVASDAAFIEAVNNRSRPRIVHWFQYEFRMHPEFSGWELPVIDDVDELGRQLELTPAQLDWLADLEKRQRRVDDKRRQHYRYRWMPKSHGGWRLLEEPLYMLKTAQRHLLHGVLDYVLPHSAACAFRRNHSVIDYAAPHTGKHVVLRMDLKDFFASIRASRVHSMFTSLGYPEDVSRVMCGLCVSTVPLSICCRHQGGSVYSAPHLPQGAPTSPSVANIAAFGMDCRLAAAAKHAGAVYTRYADDLAFSGDEAFASRIGRFQELVWSIVDESLFQINHRKTRVMRRGVRQSLCGLVVNDHLNVERQSYDRLKAILTNCIRHGLASQNREKNPFFFEQLRGRVEHVRRVAPARGDRLFALLCQINDTAATAST